MAITYDQFVNSNLPLRDRACTSKIRFLSRIQARAVMRGNHRYDGSLKPYHCPFCDGWHLGHRSRRHQPRLGVG